MNGGPALHG
jgi:cytidine deaminase